MRIALSSGHCRVSRWKCRRTQGLNWLTTSNYIDALTSTLERTLESRGLVTSDGDYRLKVVVNDIRVRSTFNAVMWGFMAGNDHLQGDAIVLNLEGEPKYEFGASASYALGGFGGGQDSSRMNWLYEEFSEMIADELVQKRDK